MSDDKAQHKTDNDALTAHHATGPTGAELDPRELRNALGAFVTGVTVITTRDKDGTPRGFTANSFTSVSLDPPLVLVCLAENAGSFDVFANCSGFAVNILSEHQRSVSGVFATSTPDRFSHISWRDGPAGNPIFEDTSTWLDCTMHNRVEAGDHTILIGRVVAFETSSNAPLGYFRGAYLTPGLEHDAIASPGQKTHVGAILEHDEKILFLAGQNGEVVLPGGSRFGAQADAKSLIGLLHAKAINADIGFLFAVFDSDTDRDLSIYYRGTLEQAPDPSSGAVMLGFDDIPWDHLRDDAVKSMIQRYIFERRQANFGIYVGDEISGAVKPLAHHG